MRILICGGESDCFNLGNKRGTSVLEVIDAAKKVTGCGMKTKNINAEDR